MDDAPEIEDDAPDGLFSRGTGHDGPSLRCAPLPVKCARTRVSPISRKELKDGEIGFRMCIASPSAITRKSMTSSQVRQSPSCARIPTFSEGSMSEEDRVFTSR